MADKLKRVKPLLAGTLAIGFCLYAYSAWPSMEKEVEKILQVCKQLEYREQCYAKSFANLTEKKDMPYAFEALRKLQVDDPKARGCHFIAHSISIAEAKKDPVHWRDVVNAAPDDCSYGAVHGPLEYYASTFPDGKIPKNEIGTLCNNPDRNNCSHGLGHVLLVVNEDNIPESVKDCENLPQGPHAIFECTTGVFMERITAINLEAHGLASKEALNWLNRLPELTALCSKQTGNRSMACWKEITHVALVVVRNDPQKIVNFCESAPGDAETRLCIDHALGIMSSHFNFDLVRIKHFCNANVRAPDFKARCYPILVSSTLSTIPSELPNAEKFCTSLEAQYQSACSKAIENFEKRSTDPIRTSD